MNDRLILGLGLSLVWIVSGAVSLRTVSRGVISRPDMVTLSRNPMRTTRISPRMKALLRITGYTLLGMGALTLVLSINGWYHGH